MEQLAKDLIKAVQSTQEHSLTEDSSLEEWLLASKDPEGYALNVDGVRIIHVRDGSVDVRYKWNGKELVNVAQGRF